ncbi:MAG: hypothetical protein ACE37F_24575 [Nannocystaceae bacterium]|nr:hypothetical protein [bacterium]
MKRAVLVVCLGLFGCDDEGGDDASSSSTGAGSTGAEGSTGSSSSTTDATTTEAGSSSTGEAGSTGGGSTGGSTGADESGSSSTGAEAVVSFADIQVDLENVRGGQGDYPSCIDGGPCHNNPQRNVVLVADPTPEQLMANYQAIVNAPATPWVTPMDDTAQMLNEVPIPADVRARWLAWIQAGAPFE